MPNPETREISIGRGEADQLILNSGAVISLEMKCQETMVMSWR